MVGSRNVKSIRYSSAFLTVLLIVVLVACSCDKEAHDQTKPSASTSSAVTHIATVVEWTGEYEGAWMQYERYIEEGKLEDALSLVEAIIKLAEETADSEQWVRGLVRQAQLRISLREYEKVVRDLEKQKWPNDLLSTTVLSLFYARLLKQYADKRAWTTRLRKKIQSEDKKVQRALGEAWKYREQLGELSISYLDEFIEPNTYPAGIRSSLRDAVSYMFVESLSDDSLWRPEHCNEIYALNLEALTGIDGSMKGRNTLAKASLKGQARYLFGSPVTNGKAKWRVRRYSIYPWWASFWDTSWRARRFKMYPLRAKSFFKAPYRLGDGQTVANGKSSLAKDGTFEIRFTPQADERLAEWQEGISYRYEMSAEVTDEGGETHSVSRDFKLGFSAVEAAIELERGFFVEGQASGLTVLRQNLDGKPLPGKGSWELFSLIQPDRVLLPSE